MYSLTEIPLQHKTVFLRVDFNVPIKKKKVVDNYKIKQSLTTIKYLLEKHCTLVIASHLGRPNGRKNKKFSLAPLAKELGKFLPEYRVVFLKNCIGKDVRKRIANARDKEIFLLENLRFYSEEKENDKAFAHSLASLADAYVNDAFGVSHRKHASLDAITHFLPSASGFLVETEILNLNKALHGKRPSVWIFGGAKLNKIKLIESALKKADKILLGGAIVFPFLKAQGYQIGYSICNDASVKVAKRLLKSRNAKKFVFPLDYVCSESFSTQGSAHIKEFDAIEHKEIALDIGPKTVELFSHYIKKAETVVWNGPLGYTEWAKYQKGSKDIAKAIAKNNGFSLCGGGESAEMIFKFKLSKKISHVSTGGGAALTYLSGEKLPALEALRIKRKRSFLFRR